MLTYARIFTSFNTPFMLFFASCLSSNIRAYCAHFQIVCSHQPQCLTVLVSYYFFFLISINWQFYKLQSRDRLFVHVGLTDKLIYRCTQVILDDKAARTKGNFPISIISYIYCRQHLPDEFLTASVHWQIITKDMSYSISYSLIILPSVLRALCA